MELLTYLLEECGGDIHIRDNDGDTPLHHCDMSPMAEFLLSRGADVNELNDNGLPAPFVALLDNNEELVEFYSAKGFDYSAVNEMMAQLMASGIHPQTEDMGEDTEEPGRSMGMD